MAAAQTAPPIAHAIGGSIGSALALLMFYPLERARIELQSQASSVSADNRQLLESVEVEIPTTRSTAVYESPTARHVVVQVAGDDNSRDINQNVLPSSTEPTLDSSSSWTPLVQSPKSADEAILTPSWSLDSSSSCSSSSSNTSITDIEQNPALTTIKKQGLWDCLLQLRAKGALYQGAAPVMTTIFTSQFVFFFLHAYVKDMLGIGSNISKQNNNGGRNNALLSLLSSCLAGVGNVLITNPLWVVNMAIVKGEAKSQNLWRELYRMIHQNGWRHMWNGTSASILLVSNPVIQFFCYEQLKQARNLRRASSDGGMMNRPSSYLPPLEAFCVGALAKGVATVTTYPLQLAQTVLRFKDNDYQGTFDCLHRLYQKGGVEEWFTGMRAKLLQTVLTAAFTFLTYEQILGAVQVAFLKSGRLAME